MAERKGILISLDWMKAAAHTPRPDSFKVHPDHPKVYDISVSIIVKDDLCAKFDDHGVDPDQNFAEHIWTLTQCEDEEGWVPGENRTDRKVIIPHRVRSSATGDIAVIHPQDMERARIYQCKMVGWTERPDLKDFVRAMVSNPKYGWWRFV